MVIRISKSKKTLEQNNRLWALYESIGDYLGYTKNEMHLLMGYEFLREFIYVGDKLIDRIKSTTELNTAEMAQYQERIEIYAGQLGWSWNDQHF